MPGGFDSDCSLVVVRLNQLRKRYAHVLAQPALSPISQLWWAITFLVGSLSPEH